MEVAMFPDMPKQMRALKRCHLDMISRPDRYLGLDVHRWYCWFSSLQDKKTRKRLKRVMKLCAS